MALAILTYNAIDLWKPVDYPTFIVDNGNQQVSTPYRTSRNIGCAGGWNLICDIAFKSMNLEKIIISQDDVYVTKEELNQLYDACSNNVVSSLIMAHFEFSCFCIHKDTFNKVGRFDENFINLYGEDADYKQRMLLSGINLVSKNMINRNKSATIQREPSVDRLHSNMIYLKYKWGSEATQPPFNYKTPFNKDHTIDYIPFSNRLKYAFTGYTNFPSIVEFERLSQG